MASRWLVYTVSTGGYDVEPASELRLSDADMAGVDFIRFVDEQSLSKLAGRPSRWRSVSLNSSSSPADRDAPQRLSRDLKIRPHRFPAVWRYDGSLYVDSNVRIHQRVWPLLYKLVLNSTDLAAYDFGRDLAGEAAWVRRYLLSRTVRFRSAEARAWLNHSLEQQVARYRRHGDHLWNRTMYGKVLLRRHNACMRTFGDLWWQEYTNGVPRDQLSLRYCTREANRRCGLRFTSLGWNGRHGPRFYRYFQVHFSPNQKGRLAGFR
ncbi:hypothetical protein AB1Y20_011601 [Prymnesium parvum]|uniref:TOD1/MUCI70 glycosyltransferase-like domain-containing protein n=1 Tax=Prymnesium parvum TaxID=97485 RepID=A0AB34IGZ9_PRYPA